MPLYQNICNFPIQLTVGRQTLQLPPGQTVNLDSAEVAAAHNSIREGLLVPVPARPMHHNDSESNLRFVEKMTELMGYLKGNEGDIKDTLESIAWRNDALSQLGSRDNLLVLIQDIDAIVAHLGRNCGPGTQEQFQQLRKLWEIRRGQLREALIPSAWERIAFDDPDEG